VKAVARVMKASAAITRWCERLHVIGGKKTYTVVLGLVVEIGTASYYLDSIAHLTKHKKDSPLSIERRESDRLRECYAAARKSASIF
jgi:hypothetical protein